MATQDHPFYEIADLAATDGPEGLALKVERGGDYVRLVNAQPQIFFKYKPDPVDSLDRTQLDRFKRLTLSQEDCTDGPEVTLDLIRSLLVKFEDYQSPQPAAQPKTDIRKK